MNQKNPKGTRLTGTERTSLQEKVLTAYRDGQSIRAIAADHHRSYGLIHGLLTQAGETLRSRGGNTRGTKRTGDRHRNADRSAA